MSTLGQGQEPLPLRGTRSFTEDAENAETAIRDSWKLPCLLVPRSPRTPRLRVFILECSSVREITETAPRTETSR